MALALHRVERRHAGSDVLVIPIYLSGFGPKLLQIMGIASQGEWLTHRRAHVSPNVWTECYERCATWAGVRVEHPEPNVAVLAVPIAGRYMRIFEKETLQDHECELS